MCKDQRTDILRDRRIRGDVVAGIEDKISIRIASGCATASRTVDTAGSCPPRGKSWSIYPAAWGFKIPIHHARLTNSADAGKDQNLKQ